MKEMNLEDIARSIKELAIDYLKEEDDLINPDTLSFYKDNIEIFKNYLTLYSSTPAVEKITHSLFMLEFLILLECCQNDEAYESLQDTKH